MCESNNSKLTITKLKLTDEQVESIVLQWYNESSPTIIATEQGGHIDDYVGEPDFVNLIEELKLDKITVLKIVSDWYLTIAQCEFKDTLGNDLNDIIEDEISDLESNNN
jgi:hypothetical protein